MDFNMFQVLTFVVYQYMYVKKIALNQIDNLDILFNSPELLILSKVNVCEFDNRNLHTSNTKRRYHSYTPESSKR